MGSSDSAYIPNPARKAHGVRNTLKLETTHTQTRGAIGSAEVKTFVAIVVRGFGFKSRFRTL